MSALSSTSRTLRYLLGIACFPKLRKLGFLEMGLGIEKRKEDFGRHWQQHLDNSIEEQKRWAAAATQTDKDASLAILGAGRLLDVALSDLSEHFSSITLIDGDPLSRGFWRGKYHARINKQIVELSGVITSWRRSLEKKKFDSWQQALETLQNEIPDSVEKLAASKAIPSAKFDAIVSLNLISQIPIVWQNVVETALRKRFGQDFVNEREEEWIRAITPSARALIEQHLRDLNSSQASDILLICDIEYARYQSSRNYSRLLQTQAPIEWQSKEQQWSSTSVSDTPEEVACELQSSLFGIDFNEESVRQGYLTNYSETASREWTWHIQPQGYEKRTSGMIHRVAAFHLRLNPL